MDRNKNSIQMGYQCKNPFVCCLFIFIYIFVSRSFPLPSAFLSTDIERGKVFGLNTLCPQRKILPETAQPPDLFPFNKVCTNLTDEQGNRRLTVCNFHIDLQMLFSISPNFSESCSMS